MFFLHYGNGVVRSQTAKYYYINSVNKIRKERGEISVSKGVEWGLCYNKPVTLYEFSFYFDKQFSFDPSHK